MGEKGVAMYYLYNGGIHAPGTTRLPATDLVPNAASARAPGQAAARVKRRRNARIIRIF